MLRPWRSRGGRRGTAPAGTLRRRGRSLRLVVGLTVDAITQVLNAIEQGDPQAASQLLPLVYEELRELAAAKLAQEPPGQTLQATALVHEAFIRLMGQTGSDWHDRSHFFAVAAQSMVG